MAKKKLTHESLKELRDILKNVFPQLLISAGINYESLKKRWQRNGNPPLTDKESNSISKKLTELIDKLKYF